MKNISVQLCAKMGGAPWGFKNLPLEDKPTLIIGIDVQHNIGANKDSVLGFTAAMKKDYSQYYVETLVKERTDSQKHKGIFHDLEYLF